MADISKNPASQAEMARLEAKLAGIEAELTAQRRAGEELLARDKEGRSEARRDRQRAGRESRVRGREVRGGTDSRPAEERLPAARQEQQVVGETTRGVEKRATAERKVSDELRLQNRLAREQARQRRLPIPASFYQPGSPAAVIPAQGHAAGQAQRDAAWNQARLEQERARSFVANEYRFRRALPPSRQLPAAGGTGGGAGGGPPPVAPPPPPGGREPPGGRNYLREAAAADRLSAADQELYARAQRTAAGERNLGNAFQQTSRDMGIAAGGYRRHGALTTEFISAAARGEVTLRELGFQVGATIAKFGGWTAAATAVYGVVGAIGAMGRGALESASGVGLLSRVTTKDLPGGADALQQQFSDLSRQFNLPIADTVQAVYGMTKVFGGDLPQAIEASKSALFAVKVGELDAGTATRYLTGIVNGFRLSAAQLGPVFDAINQAQNRFGGNTSQVIAGVAKAAGAFRLAGGGYRELIALIQTGTRLTGAPGENVGTAVARSAASVLTKQGQQRLREAGLDPRRRYPQLLAQAFQQAQGQPRERVQEIARALVPSGGQFTRIFAPLLQNRDLYERVFKSIGPKESHGSAARELSRALRQPNEELKKVVNNMERLGAVLARSGFAGPLLEMVRLLNSALNLTTQLVQTFHRLSLGADQFVVPLAEAYGIIRLLRRFDVGGHLPVGRQGGVYEQLRGGLSGGPASQVKRVRIGVRDERTFLEERNAAVATERNAAVYRARFHEAEVIRLSGAGASQEVVAREQQALETEAQRAAALEREQTFLQGQINARKEELIRFEALRKTGIDTEVAATRAGINYYGSANRPGTARAEPIRSGVFGGAARGPFGAGPPEPPPAPATVFGGGAYDPRRLNTESRTFGQRLRGWSAAQSQANVSLRTLGAITGASGRVLSGGRAAAGSALAGARRFGSSLAASIGPLDALLGGLLVLWQLEQQVSSDLEDHARRLQQFQQPTADPATLRQRASQLRHQDFGDKFLDTFASVYNSPLGYLDPSRLFTGPVQAPGDADRAAAKTSEAAAKALAQAQRHGRLLPLGKIQDRLKRRSALAQGEGEQLAAVDKAIQDVYAGYDLPEGTRKQRSRALDFIRELRARRADIAAGVGDFARIDKEVAQLDSTGLQKLEKHVEARLDLYGPSRGNIHEVQATVAALRHKIAAGDTDDKTAQALQQAQQAGQKALEDQLNRQLEGASPGQARHARSRYLGQARRLFVGGTERTIRNLRGRIRDRQAQLDELERSGADNILGVVGGLFGDHAASPATALRAKNAGDRKAIRDLRRQLGLSRAQFKAIEKEQKQAQFEADQAIYDARTELHAAGIADPLARLRYELSRNDSHLAAVARQYTKNSQQYLQALQKSRDLQSQIVDQELQNFASQQALAAARFSIGTTPAQQAGFAVAQAEQTVSKVRSEIAAHPHAVDPNKLREALTALAQAQAQAADQARQNAQETIKAYAEYRASLFPNDPVRQALETLRGAKRILGTARTAAERYTDLAEINNDRKALADAIRQRAQDMISAKSTLAQSRTEDPVRQALLQYQEAVKLGRLARTPAERINAQAAINNARRSFRQTAQREKFETLEFESDIGRISHQTEIERLRIMLKTIKGNRDLRREIQRRIYQLTHDDQNLTDLDVGNIKLPTLYEIRRAVKGGLNSHQDVRIYNSPQVTQQFAPGREDQAGVALESALAGGTRAAQRAAGLSV